MGSSSVRDVLRASQAVKHRKQTQPVSLAPLVSAAAVLTFGWAPLATSAATANEIITAQTGPILRTSQLHRATKQPTTPVSVRAVRAALTRLGVPYLWGAKGPDAVDCSGLIQWSYRQVGVTLGPDTYSQITQGTAVPNARAGDLVFPLASFNSRGPGHVLLAIEDTHAIEAPGSGLRVRVVSMPNKYVARRIT